MLPKVRTGAIGEPVIFRKIVAEKPERARK
jgi:hypothetical protein